MEIDTKPPIRQNWDPPLIERANQEIWCWAISLRVARHHFPHFVKFDTLLL